MFVVSFTRSVITKISAFVIAVAVIGGVLLYHCVNREADNKNIDIEAVGYGVDGSAGVVDFIKGFGWIVDSEPDEIREIIIPTDFNDVYNNYNEIQLEQGYDLSQIKGERVKRWTYTVTNYPGYKNNDCIKINVLVHNGIVVGGDVCSIELDGFMHGFVKDDLN